MPTLFRGVVAVLFSDQLAGGLKACVFLSPYLERGGVPLPLR